MKAAGVSTSRYCRVPDSAERFVLSKRSKSSLIFSVGKIKHCLWSFDKTTQVFDLSLFGIFQITRDQFFYSYTLRVVIEDIIDILKNINNESRWRIDISILQSSRLCRVLVLSKRSKKFFDFSVGKNQTLPLIFLTRRQGIWSLVIWNFPNNERSIFFYSYTLRVVIEDIIDILKNINNESRWRIDISILQSSWFLVKKIKEFFDFFRWKKNQTLPLIFLTRRQVVWSLVIWNFPNNERSIFSIATRYV